MCTWQILALLRLLIFAALPLAQFHRLILVLNVLNPLLEDFLPPEGGARLGVDAEKGVREGNVEEVGPARPFKVFLGDNI